MKKVTFYLLIIVLGLLSTVVFGAIPASERSALTALYNNTNGDDWDIRTGWKAYPLHTDGFAMPGTEGNWKGVTVSEDHVTRIELYYNKLSGAIPSELGNLTQLQDLDLGGNKLTGDVPSQLGSLYNLQTLILDLNKLSGGIPPELGNLTNLKALSLGINELSGAIPLQLTNLANLQYLDLEGNELTGAIPPQLEYMTKLQTLSLVSNHLSGEIPFGLGNIGHLQELSLGSNELSGVIPSSLCYRDELQSLSLSNNKLSGSIPPGLGNLDNLRYLSLGGNLLSGVIPPQLGNLSNLIQLGLGKNQLSGGIPFQLGNLSNLKFLSLDDNQLTGAIPPELGNLSNLQSLTLYYNQLSGGIPSQLGNLSKLEQFYLHYNQLSGVIPSSFTSLTKITGFLIYNNCLSATDPTLIAWLNHHDPGWENHQDRCGPLSLPTVSTNSVSSITQTDAICGGNVTSDGGARVTKRGVCWSALINPTISDSLTNDGCCEGNFASAISGLNPGTKYYARAYATNYIGTSYGANVSFTTPPPPGFPFVTTSAVSSITNTGAICGGNVISDGGSPVTSRGVCWTITPNPTIFSFKTTDGSGTGNFTSAMTGLYPKTTYHVRAYATNANGTSYGENIRFIAQKAPVIGITRTTLYFNASETGNVTGPQIAMISNTGNDTLNWAASSRASWISFTPSSGTGDSALTVSVDPTGLAAGHYYSSIQVTDPNAPNSPQYIYIKLIVYRQGETTAPFGDFVTPQDGSTVNNSIPVTGWALDDIGISNVKIYNGDAYIGDAVFVDGARPDVEVIYPDYPNNYKAGWGYMLLTHSLPNGGNGTYTLVAKATDIEGNEVTLGTKTITIDNAHAVKPFGAIDTPTQGGAASGKDFLNFGWALTPQPNTIPIDGSTINVVIDGVVKGHPGYNVYRSDIAGLFPGYSNTEGAGGYYYIDTTKLTNGVHTIAWTATDNAANTDGIGSRYFTVMNAPTIGDEVSSVREKGFDTAELCPDERDVNRIEIKELERVEVNIFSLTRNTNTITKKIAGYMVVGNELRELPIGSSLDTKSGVFYWQPGPGFVGEYRLLFVGKDNEGHIVKKNIIIHIKPTFL